MQSSLSPTFVKWKHKAERKLKEKISKQFTNFNQGRTTTYGHRRTVCLIILQIVYMEEPGADSKEEENLHSLNLPEV
jgi:hypothetical protein